MIHEGDDVLKSSEPQTCPDRPTTSFTGVLMRHREQKTCHVCISRHMNRFDDAFAERMENIKSYVEKDLSIELAHELVKDYPECLLLDCLFDAVEHDAWSCLNVLLQEKSANTWLQFSNDKGENILQKILSKPRVNWDEAEFIILDIIDRLRHTMDSVALASYVNKVWHKQTRVQMYVWYNHSSPLMMAMSKPLNEVVAQLLDCGADPNCTNQDGSSALGDAAARGDVDMIHLLLSHGAVFNKHGTEQSGRYSPLLSLLHKAKNNDRVFQCAITLIEEADFITLEEYDGILPHINDHVLRVLIAKGLPLRVHDVHDVRVAVSEANNEYRMPTELEIKQCAFVMTAANNKCDAIDCLCESASELGIHIDKPSEPLSFVMEDCIQDITGHTALQAACKVGHHEAVECLLANGADPDACGNTGEFPICHVMEYEQQEAIRCASYLIRYGCAVNLDKSRLGKQAAPLDYFLAHNELFIAKMLVIAGAKRSGVAYSTDYDVLSRICVPVAVCTGPMKRELIDGLNAVPSLYQLCRIVVRQAMHRDIPSKIQTLPLATHIKESLNLSDLDEIEHAFMKYQPVVQQNVMRVMRGGSEDDFDSSESDE